MGDFAAVDELVRAAGRLALSHFERVDVRFKADESPVTVADGAVEALVRDTLSCRFPGVGFTGEEGGGGDGAHRRFILDPIDGTSAFAAGLPLWGVALAYATGTRVEAGWLHLPVTGQLYTFRDGLACRNGKRIAPAPPPASPEEATLLVPSTAHRDYALDFPGKCRAFGSTALHALYAALGRAEGALVGRVHLWDLASALPFLDCFGGAMEHLDGSPVDLAALFATGRLPKPALIARSPEALARLRGAATPRIPPAR